MNGKVHATIGVATLGCLALKQPNDLFILGMQITPVIALATAAAGSYAPDIDLGRSHAGMKHKITSKVVSKVGGGHRGITHTLLVPAIVLAFMLFINTYLASAKYLLMLLNSLCFGWEWGYLMHIAADMFNGKGVPLFWPLLKTKVHIADLPSTGFVPWIFTFIVCGAFLVCAIGGIF